MPKLLCNFVLLIIGVYKLAYLQKQEGGFSNRVFKGKKETEGPFKATRILDTPEAKIDQVFTKEEKTVALFTTIT